MNYGDTRKDISLLFPDSDKSGGLYSESGISEETAKQLDLYSLLDLHTIDFGAFFTCDPAVIRYRQMTFADLCEIYGLCDVLSRMLPFLTDIKELRKMSSHGDGIGDSYLYSISEIEIYNSLMELLHSEVGRAHV